MQNKYEHLNDAPIIDLNTNDNGKTICSLYSRLRGRLCLSLAPIFVIFVLFFGTWTAFPCFFFMFLLWWVMFRILLLAFLAVRTWRYEYNSTLYLFDWCVRFNKDVFVVARRFRRLPCAVNFWLSLVVNLAS